jgi:hypothetical protein
MDSIYYSFAAETVEVEVPVDADQASKGTNYCVIA